MQQGWFRIQFMRVRHNGVKPSSFRSFAKSMTRWWEILIDLVKARLLAIISNKTKMPCKLFEYMMGIRSKGHPNSIIHKCPFLWTSPFSLKFSFNKLDRKSGSLYKIFYQKLRKFGPFWAEWVVQDLIINCCIKLMVKPKKNWFPAKHGWFFSIFGKFSCTMSNELRTIKISWLSW